MAEMSKQKPAAWQSTKKYLLDIQDMFKVSNRKASQEVDWLNLELGGL